MTYAGHCEEAPADEAIQSYGATALGIVPRARFPKPISRTSLAALGSSISRLSFAVKAAEQAGELLPQPVASPHSKYQPVSGRDSQRCGSGRDILNDRDSRQNQHEQQEVYYLHRGPLLCQEK